MKTKTEQATARPNEAKIEIESSLSFLDKQLWPSQSGWSDEMQIAIENLHFHKSQILNMLNEWEALNAIVGAARQAQRALQHIANITDETRAGWALKATDEALATLSAIRAKEAK